MANKDGMGPKGNGVRNGSGNSKGNKRITGSGRKTGGNKGGCRK